MSADMDDGTVQRLDEDGESFDRAFPYAEHPAASSSRICPNCGRTEPEHDGTPVNGCVVFWGDEPCEAWSYRNAQAMKAHPAAASSAPLSATPDVLQGSDPLCKADCGYPALCEMYPTEQHVGCPRQLAALTADRDRLAQNYDLLKRAVNSCHDEHLPGCDNLGCAEGCPSSNAAAWLAEKQAECDRLARRVEALEADKAVTFGADRMAVAIFDLVQARAINTRSPGADALEDYIDVRCGTTMDVPTACDALGKMVRERLKGRAALTPGETSNV
jgi:hypothetical protein